jgi:glycerophosphoryl diester phosphodiesterase
VVEDTRVASFEQFIVEAKKHGIKMFVELKEVRDRTDVLIREFVRILRTHKYTDQVVLLSFFPSIITRVKELEPSIYSTMLFHPTGLSVWCDLRVHSNSLVWKVVCQRPDILDEVAFNFVLPVASWFKADAVGLAVPTLTKEVVSKFLNSGFGVFAWTVNSREEKSRLMSDGVRILISDCPGGECDSVMTHFPPATKPPMLRSGR